MHNDSEKEKNAQLNLAPDRYVPHYQTSRKASHRAMLAVE